MSVFFYDLQQSIEKGSQMLSHQFFGFGAIFFHYGFYNVIMFSKAVGRFVAVPLKIFRVISCVMAIKAFIMIS